MSNRVPESVDVGFRILSSNKYLVYGIEQTLDKIMRLYFDGVSYDNNYYQENYTTRSSHIFYIIDADTSFIANEFMPRGSSAAFCFIMPERSRRHMIEGSTVIYVHQSLRIVEQELTTAIRALIRPRSLRSRAHSRNINLTPRQREILHYLLKGSTIDEIARKTNIAIKTVYTHRQTVYSRLGVRNMAEFYKQKEMIELLYYSDESAVQACNCYCTCPVR